MQLQRGDSNLAYLNFSEVLWQGHSVYPCFINMFPCLPLYSFSFLNDSFWPLCWFNNHLQKSIPFYELASSVSARLQSITELKSNFNLNIQEVLLHHLLQELYLFKILMTYRLYQSDLAQLLQLAFFGNNHGKKIEKHKQNLSYVAAKILH